MYYEEQIIDGVLCWRNNPRASWTPCELTDMAAKLMAARARLSLAEKVVVAAEARQTSVRALADALTEPAFDAACAAIKKADEDIWSSLAAYRSAK